MTSFMNLIALLVLSVCILQVSGGEWTEEEKQEWRKKMETCVKDKFKDDEQFEKLLSIYEDKCKEKCKCNGKGKKKEDLSEEEKQQWEEEKQKKEEECKKCMVENGADQQQVDKAIDLKKQCYQELKGQTNPEEAQSEPEPIV